MGTNAVTDFQATCSVAEDDFFSESDRPGLAPAKPKFETHNQIGVLGKIRSLRHLDLSRNRIQKDHFTFVYHFKLKFSLLVGIGLELRKKFGGEGGVVAHFH